jgi:S1-C subfamily serine protease
VGSAGSGVFVPASAVLNLARVGVLPQAAPVPAAGARPAGLKLSGVGGLGLGMRDGDVLTRVAGTPVASVSQVVGLVIQAREKRARHISAEFFRDGSRWSLTVEQPYLQQ